MEAFRDDRALLDPGMDGVKDQECVEGAAAPMDCDKSMPSSQEEVPYLCPNQLLIRLIFQLSIGDP